MSPSLPKITLEESALLRAVVDGTVVQVYKFWWDGEYSGAGHGDSG